MFLTDGKSLMVNHRLWRIEEILQEHPNFVRINRSEIVNLDAVDGFEGRSAVTLGHEKAARKSSHEDSRTAWSCLLWSRDVRVIPTSRCDFALTA